MNWLFLAPAPGARAEATQGLHIAERLRARGDQVHLLARQVHSLTSATVEIGMFTEEESLTLQVRREVRRSGAQAIVLCDLVRTVLYLASRHAHDALDVDLPVIGIDPWDIASLGGELDPFPKDRLQLAAEVIHHENVLRPVPFITQKRMNTACVLPPGAPLSSQQKHEVRANLGLPGSTLVAFAHEPWQHQDFDHNGLAGLRRALPTMVMPVLHTLDLEVVDIGPIPLPGLDAPHVPDPALLGAVDLVLSTSAMSPLNAIAAVRGVPVVTLVHSGAPTESLPWAFQAWPASFDVALRRLLRHNRWAEVLNRAEIAEPEQLEAKLEALLPGSWAREGLEETAAAVVEEIRALPAPEQVLDAML